jgi:hypothetical protein
MERMAAVRLPARGRHLIWLWARSSRNRFRGSPVQGEVVLTMSIPRDHVLLSEFRQWHDVLNDQPTIPQQHGESDDDWWTRAEPVLGDSAARVTAAGVPANPGHRNELPQRLHDEVEHSWDAIFEPNYWHREDWIQGVVHEIRAEQVVRAVRTMGRRSQQEPPRTRNQDTPDLALLPSSPKGR